MLIHHAAAMILLVAALVCDVKSMRIPNALTIPACAAAWVYFTITDGTDALAGSLAGTLAGLLPMLILYALKGIGAGDVKLFAALGSWVGVLQVLHMTVYSVLFAGVIGLVIIIARHPIIRRAATLASGSFVTASNEVQPARETGKYTRFPFMLAVAPAAVVWYLNIYLGG
ncbi:prepilin peptidase [Paenibacillus tarimensis]